MADSHINTHYGTLYFIPVTMGADNITTVLPPDVVSLTQSLASFIVENEKTARHFLSAIKHPKPIRELELKPLNKRTEDKALPALLSSLIAGGNVGLMSEAGCPGIADPGARLAALAHKKGIRVAPLVGPSSILLSLMASGLNGHRNQHMLEDILSHCGGETELCIACNISLPDELIVTKRVRAWKQTALPDLHKKPTVFLLLA